jgi:hypothetical protein
VPFPVEYKYIDETQQKLKVRFPLDYVARMKRENGGVIYVDDEAWFLFPIFDTTDDKRLKRTCNDVCHETKEMFSFDVGFPMSAVAIANNGAGDVLFFMPDEREPERLLDKVFCFRLRGGEVVDIEATFSELDESRST